MESKNIQSARLRNVVGQRVPRKLGPEYVHLLEQSADEIDRLQNAHDQLVRQLKIARSLLSEVLDMNEDDAFLNFKGQPSSRFDKVADRIQALLDGGS